MMLARGVVLGVLIAGGATAQWDQVVSIGCGDGSVAASRVVALDPEQEVFVTAMPLTQAERQGTDSDTRLELRKLAGGDLLASRSASIYLSDVVALGSGPVVAYTTEMFATVTARPLTLWWPSTGQVRTADRFAVGASAAQAGDGAVIRPSSFVVPAFSPDGSRLAVIGVRNQGGRETLLLVVLDVASGDSRVFSLPGSLSEKEAPGVRTVLSGLVWDSAAEHVTVSWRIVTRPSEYEPTSVVTEVAALDVQTSRWNELGRAPTGTIGMDGRGEFLVHEEVAGRQRMKLPQLVDMREYFASGRVMSKVAVKGLPALVTPLPENAQLAALYRGASRSYIEVYVPGTASAGCVRLFALRP